MGGLHLRPSAIPGQILSNFQSAGTITQSNSPFPGWLLWWMTQLEEGQKYSNSVLQISSPANTQRPPPKSEAVCLMPFAPYPFLLLLFLLASALSVDHTLTFLMLDTAKPCSEPQMLLSLLWMQSCEMFYFKKHSQGIYLVIYHLRTRAAHPFFLNVDLYFHAVWSTGSKKRRG